MTLCRCNHTAEAHRHYTNKNSKYCSQCAQYGIRKCPRYRFSLLAWLRRHQTV
jgi:undecaprenyl pyrophosphate synthase